MSNRFLGLVAVMAAAGGAAVEDAARTVLLAKEAEMALGGKLELDSDEERANEVLMKHKLQEIHRGFVNPEEFDFSHHYFEYKKKIPQSEVYKIIKKMPKGAALHIHDTALLGPDYLLNLTYKDDLYICFDGDTIHLQFSDGPPKNEYTGWVLIKTLREASGNQKKFDAQIRKHFTIVIDNPKTVDTDVNAVWRRLMKVFMTITPMLTYRSVWEEYFYDALKEFRDDNIMYMEIRSTLPPLYDLDGTTYDSFETARVYKKSYDRFMADYPDFIGAKIIYAPLRLVEPRVVEEYLNTAKKLKAELGDFIAGFDLVGQEDLGRPLDDFLPLLKKFKHELDYFFHAGETNWWGTSSDENIADAILLGTKRLGHGYAILKHPLLMDMVKEKKIGLEVNVISNQVLGLVENVQNHPLAYFLAHNLPVVLSSDDPGLWEAEPLSHDLYVALVGVANRHAGLRTLKQLALNSLQFSAMDETMKTKAVEVFHARWDKFVKIVANE